MTLKEKMLLGFVGEIVGDFPEIGDVDGLQLQEIAERHGLLERKEMPEPCGANCQCRDEMGSDDFPVICFRITPLLKEARKVFSEIPKRGE